jgi:large subunit ribosomal protein L4
MYRSALRSILSRLVNEERLIIINNLEINEPPKTSDVRNLLLNLNLSKAVFVLHERNKNFEIASHNLFEVKIQTINSLNPLELINADKVVFTVPAIKSLEEVL